MLWPYVGDPHQAHGDRDDEVPDYVDSHDYDYARFGRREKLAASKKSFQPTARSEPGGGFLSFSPLPESSSGSKGAEDMSPADQQPEWRKEANAAVNARGGAA